MSKHPTELNNLSLLLTLWWTWYRERKKTQPLNSEEIDRQFISLISWSLVYFLLDGKISSSKWAPIIYGRTYSVDFRFLVTPCNFEEQQKDFFWNYIKVTTRSAENLPGKPRWIFLRTEKRCLVGVTCMVRDLIGSHTDQDSEDLTRDRQGRPLYAFVGYVSENPTPFGIPARNLELFAAPYLKFVSQKWQEVYADLGSNQAAPQDLKSEYEREFSLDELATPEPEPDPILIDQLIPISKDSIIFWNISEARNLWFAASEDDKPLSIFFGNLTKRELINSNFGNAALEEVQSRKEEEKVIAIPRPPSHIKVENRAYAPSPSQSKKRKVSTPNVPAIPINQIGQGDASSGQIEHGDNWVVDITVNLSRLSRDIIESALGEGAARQIDDMMLKTWGNTARLFLGNEAVDEMYERITNIDEWERRLRLAIEAALDTLAQLKKQREELVRQGLAAEVRKINEKIKLLRTRVKEATQSLSQIEKLRSRRADHSSQSRQASSSFQRDPSFGFREKEETVENEQLDRETQSKNSSSSQDVWEL